ncbi:hypothetical protein D1871_02375 [Nakamurella silvestris]|nr:hypothetical protein D1871_02375 [Nakamurella silvestris]
MAPNSVVLFLGAALGCIIGFIPAIILGLGHYELYAIEWITWGCVIGGIASGLLVAYAVQKFRGRL